MKIYNIKKSICILGLLISSICVLQAQNYIVYRKDTVGGTGVVQLVTKPYLDAHTGISTVYTTAPILGDGSSGSHVRADTTYKNGSLGTYSQHYKDSIAITLKQATLVSGLNIKTINGNSLLGSGNMSLVITSSDSIGYTTAIPFYNKFCTHIRSHTLAANDSLTVSTTNAVLGGGAMLLFKNNVLYLPKFSPLLHMCGDYDVTYTYTLLIFIRKWDEAGNPIYIGSILNFN
jgi:hypothetical protein